MSLPGTVLHERRQALESVFLVLNAIIWYFLALLVLEGIAGSESYLQTQLLWSVHITALAVSLVAGTLLIAKIGRKGLFMFWTLLGVVSPLALFALNFAPTIVAFSCSILFAVSIGLGMPNCMEYFVRSTHTGSRGRYAGLILLLSGIGLFSLRLIGEGIVISALVLIVWRISGLTVTFASKPFKEERNNKSENLSYSSLFHQRPFILYIIPWIMFSLVDYLSAPVASNILGQSTFATLNIIESAVSGAAAIAAGFLIDHFGRKQAAIAGFAMMGLTYAVLGFYPNNTASWYIYTVFDGITWGIFGILFIFCIWGELNQNAPTDKYYALGILPFFISRFIELTSANYISASVDSYTLFSFTAFFLFLAVLPLAYAPETLPEKILKDRDLKNYVEKALKEVQKETEKSSKKGSAESEKKDKGREEGPADSSEYDEAQKLAEKYY